MVSAMLKLRSCIYEYDMVREGFLCGPLRISVFSALIDYLNAEGAKIRRGPQRITSQVDFLHVHFGGDEAETSLLITRQDAAKYLECLFAPAIVEVPVADAVKNAMRRSGVALCFTQELFVGKDLFQAQRCTIHPTHLQQGQLFLPDHTYP